MAVRSVALIFSGLMMGVAAIVTMAGCAPSTTQE